MAELLVGVEADLLLHEDADAVAAKAGSSGVRADVLGAGAPGGDGPPAGDEERSSSTDGAPGKPEQETGGTRVPVHPRDG